MLINLQDRLGMTKELGMNDRLGSMKTRGSAKQVKDSAYHKENMLLYKQEEAGVRLSIEQQFWIIDSDDEPTNQELEAHYLYMTKIQEVIPAFNEDIGPTYDIKPFDKSALRCLVRRTSKYSKSITSALEDLTLRAGNPVKKVLLMNLPDH
ncbi:hypothetical protein Tco_0695793, partial [Tanacetum coccineum]